jgi:hypothetical protein
MQLFTQDTDIDRAIAEFERDIGKHIKDVQRQRFEALLAQIAGIEARILKRRAQHKRTEELSREYCELTAKRIQFELAA